MGKRPRDWQDTKYVLANFGRTAKKAISIIESIKGEPALPGFKGTCETCPYQCKFAGKKIEEIPAWLKD